MFFSLISISQSNYISKIVPVHKKIGNWYTFKWLGISISKSVDSALINWIFLFLHFFENRHVCLSKLTLSSVHKWRRSNFSIFYNTTTSLSTHLMALKITINLHFYPLLRRCYLWMTPNLSELRNYYSFNRSVKDDLYRLCQRANTVHSGREGVG